MGRRVVARGRTAIVLAVLLLVGSYVFNGWLVSKGLHPFMHSGGRGGHRPYVRQCTAFGLSLWMPCWVAGGAPAVLFLLGVGAARRD